MKFLVALGVFVMMVIVTDAGVSMNNPFFCYITDPIRSMTNMFSVSTSYEAVRRFNFSTVNPYVSTCTPSKIWFLGRYGGRFPHPDLMEQMIDLAESSIQDDIENNYNAGRTTLCRQDFEAIQNWTRPANFNLPNASLSTEAGAIANRNIARRFQQLFPDILTETYDPNRFLFRHTDLERTNTSLRAFTSALFGDGAQNVVYEDIPDPDWFLRPFDVCEAFLEETENSIDQQLALRQGPEVEEMLTEVNRKLGFHGSNPLNFDTVLAMWEWCRFETASTFEFSGSENGGDSAWCAPFSVAHHLLFEYHDDLFHFHYTGYGVRNQRLVENLNCGVMQDLLHFIDSNNDDDVVARIFMSHRQIVQTMMVVLGSFRDTWPLHQHNYAQQSGRNWLTSIMTPLGTNLVVIRYDCDDDDDLVFLLNERPILVPGCDQQTGVCKVSVFLDRFRRFIGVNCEEYYCTDN